MATRGGKLKKINRLGETVRERCRAHLVRTTRLNSEIGGIPITGNLDSLASNTRETPGAQVVAIDADDPSAGSNVHKKIPASAGGRGDDGARIANGRGGDGEVGDAVAIAVSHR